MDGPAPSIRGQPRRTNEVNSCALDGVYGVTRKLQRRLVPSRNPQETYYAHGGLPKRPDRHHGDQTSASCLGHSRGRSCTPHWPRTRKRGESLVRL